MGSRSIFYLFFWDAACFAATRRARARALIASSRRFRFRRSSRRRSVPRPDKQTSSLEYAGRGMPRPYFTVNANPVPMR